MDDIIKYLRTAKDRAEETSHDRVDEPLSRFDDFIPRKQQKLEVMPLDSYTFSQVLRNDTSNESLNQGIPVAIE